MKSGEVPQSTDVIVVGAGIAGHSAALAAAEQGARVCLLEKMPDPGGSSAQAVGGFAFAGTDLQRESGVEDSNDLLRQDMLKSGESRNDPALLELMLDRQLDAYCWLREKGVKFTYAKPSAPGSAVHIHSNGPAQAINALHERVLADPRVVWVGAADVERLERSVGEGAKVTGVRVRRAAAASTLINSGGGVVLATGGFSRSRKLLETFAPELLGAVQLGGRGNTGDGIRMACALGAGIADMGWVTGTFGVALLHYPDLAPREEELPGLLFSFYSGAVIVNLAGRRFGNESASYKALGALCAAQPRSIAFQLFDQKTMDVSRPASAHNFRAALERGEVRQADSLESLAQLLGIDAAGLTDTIATYNRDAESGVDSAFGRKIPMKIDQAPFYAYPCGVAVTTTFCGLTIDTSTRVLDVFGEPIAGLYAAGETVAGFHGSNYMSGSALTKAVITGRIAGANAAADSTRAPAGATP